MLLTDIRDKKREEEKKNAETKQAGADKENNKTNEKTAPSLAAGKSVLVFLDGLWKASLHVSLLVIIMLIFYGKFFWKE